MEAAADPHRPPIFNAKGTGLFLAANTIGPEFATPKRQSKIDPFAEKLSGWLKTEAGKSRKQRRTMKQLHADLMALAFTGSHAWVAAFAHLSDQL